jgi:hypothetical protein
MPASNAPPSARPSAGDAAVLGRQNAFDDLHFGHRLDAHHVDLVLAAVLRHRAPFGIRVRLGAVDRDAGAAGRDAVQPHVAGVAVGARREREDAGDVAALQRQLADDLSTVGQGLLRRSGLDQRHGGLHRHRLLDAAQLNLKGLTRRLPRTHLQAAIGQRFESGELDGERVRARRQRGHDELSACIGDDVSDETGAFVRHRDVRARQHGTSRVAEHAEERGGRHLRAQPRRWREDGGDGN